VLVTVGGSSPPIRSEAAEALHARFGYEYRIVPGTGHALHLDAPGAVRLLVDAVASGE
jgi:pimeloyl-ACP methyl ester carboxylesterase